ncbi:MAG: ABC transporter ATP-binding protein [Thermoprotei archaeon]|jgi:energy-coupling factor transport system ATP-binding protein
MLSVNNLTINERVKTPVSFLVENGEIANLVGPTGSGKTSVLMAIAQLLQYDGSIKLDSLNLKNADKKWLARHVGFVLDDVERQLVAHKVADEVAFTLENLSWDRRSINERIVEVLRKFNVEYLMWRPLNTLSSGEKVRVALASAMVADPDILLIDNVFSRIDPPTSKEFMEHMKKIVLNGKIIVTASYEEIQNGKNIHMGIIKEPLMVNVLPKKVGDVIVELDGIQYGYRKEEPLLNDVSFEIKRSEVIALLGRNGSGKSTLSKIITGLIRPWGGVLKIHGRIAYVPEDPNLLFVKSTPYEDIALSIKISKNAMNVEDLLRDLDILQYANYPVYSLSRGLKKVVSIAISLALKPDVLIIDEPTVGLDNYYKSLISLILSKLVSMGVTLMFITHDINFALKLADRFLVLGNGRIKYDGEPTRSIEL